MDEPDAPWQNGGMAVQADQPDGERLVAAERHVQHLERGPLPRFWLAALASLGDDVALGMAVPDYYSETTA
jgi:hypothetical protein